MKLFLRSITLFIFTSFTPLALGQVISWTGTGPDSSFDNGANWTTDLSTGTIPSSSDDVFILPGMTTVATPSVPQITVTQGGPTTITISTSNNQSIRGLAISSTFQQDPTATTIGITNGTLDFDFNAGSTLTVGADGAVVTGTATVNYTGNFQMLSGGDLVVGTATSPIDSAQITGSGTLNILSGTFNLDGAAGSSFSIGDNSIGAVTQGNLVANSSSTVNAGNLLQIGLNGGTGTYSLAANSILNIGNLGSPQNTSYFLIIGENTGSVGTLNISDNSTINASNPNTTVAIGAGSGATGTVTQSGTSTVNLGGASSTLTIGDQGTGTYNLQSGTLNITNSSTSVGHSGGTGTLTQSGGALTIGSSTTFVIGNGGTGTYTFSSGTADFQNGFTVGSSGGTGTVTQSGGTLTTENTVSDIGVSGTGTYNLSSGTATFSGGITVGGTGTVNQTGGTLTVPLGATLDLSASGSTYNLNGGTLQIENNGTNGFVGSSGQGSFNFGGGTLQTLGGGGSTTLTDGLDGTLTNTSTLDTTNNGIYLSGNLTGTGGFTIIGGGTVSLLPSTGSDTYTGTTDISNGTLITTADAFPVSSNIMIGNSSTLDMSMSGADTTNTLFGSLSGTGQFNLTFGATANDLQLASTVNFTGTTLLSGSNGTLQVYNGTLGNIQGNGSKLTIGGGLLTTGTVNLTGSNNTFTGLTTVNPLFTLNATNLSGSVTNNGTLAVYSPSNTPGTFTIGGNLTSTDTLAVRTNGTTADQYQVNGTATVSGKILVSAVGTNTYTILTSSGLTIGGNGNLNDPAGLQTVPNLDLLTYTLSDTSTDLILTTSQSDLTPFAVTPNQKAVAGALDPVIQNPPANLVPILLALDANPGSAVPLELDQLSPENLQYMRDIAFENSTFQVQEVNGYLTHLRNGYSGLDTSSLTLVHPGFNSNLGRSLGSLLAYNPPSFNRAAPNGINYYPQDDSTPPSSSSQSSPISRSSSQTISDSPDPLTTLSPAYAATHYEGPNFGGFIGGDFIVADLNQNQSAVNAAPGKASYTAGSATAGVSFRVTANLAVGVLANYNHTDAKTDSNGSKIKVDSYSPGFYGTFFKDGFYANGLFSYGFNSYSETRNINFAGLTAKGSPDGSQYVGNLDVGYDFQPEKHWILGPDLGVTYTHLDVDSFNETGAGGADLNVNSQSADSLRSRFGGHVVYQTHSGSVLLQPNFTAMWQHEYLDDSSGITSQFNIPGTAPFSIRTAAPSRDSALLGCGLTATLDTSMVLYLNYLADVGADDYLAQSVTGGFKASF